MRTPNAFSFALFAMFIGLPGLALGCGSGSSAPPSVTLPAPAPAPVSSQGEQGEPLEVGALPGTLHIRFVFGVTSGDPLVMAQTFARFARLLDVAHYRIKVEGITITVEIEGPKSAEFRDAILNPVQVDFYRAADEVDAFSSSSRVDLPPDQGVELGLETVPMGKGNVADRHFLKIRGNEAPLRDLLERLSPPRPGLRFLLQDLREWDNDTGSERLVGARTVLIEMPSLLGSRHIVNAHAVDEPDGRPNSANIVLTFDSSGAEIFRRVTEKLIKRRFVVALNDRAVMVPIVMDEIKGGKTWISVPAGRDALEDARELAAKIKRGPIPGKLDFQVEDRIR